MRRPQLLLLDKPFAALDSASAEGLLTVLLDLHRAWGTTTLLVSYHDADVRPLSDRVIRLEARHVVADQRGREGMISALIPKRVERIYVDDVTGQWVIETATAQFHLTNADCKAVSPGDVVQLTRHSSSTRSM